MCGMLEQYENVVAQHKDLVFSFAYYYLGNRAEAEDVTQDVFLKLWSHWDSVPQQAAASWLNRVTRNTSFDLLRRRKTKNRYVVDTEASELSEVAPDRLPDPHDDAEGAEFSRQLRQCVESLPEPYRSAMILREIQELTYREVSELLDQPVNTIKTQVHRGRKLLRERFLEVSASVAS